ncbi:hypothetical protein TTHERM_00191500 (macronuclear) [Tetrahymena thermophila SB210]|uniref:Uncharacterized protein n=1 Tax=Tetrahymena thermophila (strain SB210) TaxID=312017 RepID=I7MJN6_TETTS|nr:hypothetical protein TTHERM_00191500 [Tetrahymena thermophila SB210]EAR96482.2 hypothetical protein TTHERM_00191500 [Tetrahymena thermophila SB210]|eukprot:XP_001016727.2 hypothetical protein TTHERM_00191500 [Tetrahymena thermophila SB210]
MDQFILGIANKRAENKVSKIKHQSSLYQFENEYEQQNELNENEQQKSINRAQASRQTLVQIDDIMLFFLQTDLQQQTQKLVKTMLQRMKKTEDIQAKLQQNLSNKYPLSAQMMSSLYNYFKINKTTNKKMLKEYEQWNQQFPCQLVVKNDGNSFYRSLLLQYILHVVLSQDKQKLEQVINQIMDIPTLKYNQDDLQALKEEDIKYCVILFLVTNFQKIQNKKMFSLIDFYLSYNQNPLIDISSVIIIRNILYYFYIKIKQSGNYRGWIDTFEQQKNHIKLLKDGAEAEQQIMILSSRAFEIKLFALTFFSSENGMIQSEMNELFMQQEEYETQIYLIQQNQQFNILFDLEFMRNNEIFFLKFLDVQEDDQIIIYFEKNGQVVKQVNELVDDQKQLKSQKHVQETNFFQRMQLQDPQFALRESLLQDFGFKKQINAIQQQTGLQSSIVLDKSRNTDQELPLFNPLAKQESFLMDFKQYLENQQISNIEQIKKEDESQFDLQEADQIHTLIGDIHSNQHLQKKQPKKVRMSLAEISEGTPTNNPDESISSTKSIIKKQKRNQMSQVQSQEVIETLQSDDEDDDDEKTSQTTFNKEQLEAVVYDDRCLDCDQFTNIEERRVVTKILEKIKICNKCVVNKANFLQQNKLSSLSFYGVNLYRFQLFDLIRDLELLVQQIIDSKISASLFNIKGDEDDSLEIVKSQNLMQQMQQASLKQIAEEQKSLKMINTEFCQYCDLPNKQTNLKTDLDSYFLKIDNFDKTQQLLICKKCLNFLNQLCENRQYMNLFQVKNTYIDPREVEYQFDRIIQLLNKSGQLIQCQFYCKIEQKTDNFAYSLFDTQVNQLIQRKICLPCFEKILNSSMNVDDFIESSCQVELFSTIFREDFLNNLCISCNTKQIPGKNEFIIKSNQEIQQNNPQNLYFRVTEQSEKFDSYVCLTCIKNILIDQYTQLSSTQNIIEGEKSQVQEVSRIFKILYKKIGVIFCFSYSPIINRQILKALQNEASKDQTCFKCQTKDQKQPIYFLDNPWNFSICQMCFIIIQKKNKKSEILSNLNVSESSYQILKEGTLQNSLQQGYCFCCIEFNNAKLYSIWVKNYGRVLKICQNCVLLSKPYVGQGIWEVFSSFFDEKVLYQSVDIPQELLHQLDNNQQELLANNQQPLQDQNKIDTKCFACQEQKKKTIKMFDCDCQVCIKCISKVVKQDEKDFTVCPVSHCIKIYKKLQLIVYLDQYIKQQEYKIQQKKLNQKLAKQNKTKYLCNSCQRPHTPIILTKQKYCSCVILCKQCLISIYKSKQCYKCLESNCNVCKSDIEIFEENQLCCSCLQQLNTQDQNSIQDQNKLSELNKLQKKILICGNCLYQLNLNY